MGRTILKLDAKPFKEYGEKLDRLGADLKAIFTDALEQAGETIENDTLAAVAKENLPAGGHYSSGETERSVIRDPRVSFDFGKPGAGGFLITGTPRMRPDAELQAIYKQKRYMTNIKKDMVEIFEDEIERRMR